MDNDFSAKDKGGISEPNSQDDRKKTGSRSCRSAKNGKGTEAY